MQKGIIESAYIEIFLIKIPNKENNTTKQPDFRRVVNMISISPKKPSNSIAGRGMSKEEIIFFSTNILK